jgi:hypothetical protein
MTKLEDTLSMIARLIDPYPSIERFILNYGQQWPGRPLPANYNKRKPGYCYMNSYRLMISSELRYVEGYAQREELSIPVLHAWCLDEDDAVVDTTWARPETCQYFGVVMPRDWYIDQVMNATHYGSLDRGIGPNFPFMGDYLEAIGEPIPEWLAVSIAQIKERSRGRTNLGNSRRAKVSRL